MELQVVVPVDDPKLASKLLAEESAEESAESQQLASLEPAAETEAGRHLEQDFDSLVGRDRMSDEQYFAHQHGAVVDGVEREDAFNEVVAPLEERQRRRLAGPGRGKCLAAFRSHPVAFDGLVQEVLERWDRGGISSPLGLLCKMVSDGEHRLDLIEAESADVIYLRDRRAADA